MKILCKHFHLRDQSLLVKFAKHYAFCIFFAHLKNKFWILRKMSPTPIVLNFGFGSQTTVLNFGLGSRTTEFIFGLGSPTTLLNFGFVSRTTVLNIGLSDYRLNFLEKWIKQNKLGHIRQIAICTLETSFLKIYKIKDQPTNSTYVLSLLAGN